MHFFLMFFQVYDSKVSHITETLIGFAHHIGVDKEKHQTHTHKFTYLSNEEIL